MQHKKVTQKRVKWWYALIFIAIIAAILILDILSKEWIRASLPPGGAFPEIGRLTIVNVQNTGSAFGLFTNQAFLLSIVAIAGLVVVLLFFKYLGELGFMGGLALSFIFAGALGNLIDRLRFGRVTDFIYVRLWDNVYWPAFNVADSAITVGAILLAFVALVNLGKKHEPKPGNTKKDI
ncbi:MAG: signal peptidase II [Dehalococcoidia bacterium]